MARILIFGSRSLTWRHLHVMRIIANHALREPCDLATFIHEADMVARSDSLWQTTPCLPDTESLVLHHGDGPPGKTPGAVGADKLAEGACVLEWPERRVLRRHPVVPEGDESWGLAARRRNIAMVEAKPHRVYAVHSDLDSSKGSAMTADLLKRAGIPYVYVRVTTAGAVLSVELR